MALWATIAPTAGLLTTLLSLGLDRDRALVVINLVGAATSAGLVALLTSGPVLLPWAIGAIWYAAIFGVPTAIRARPVVLPGETLDATQYAIAVAGLISIGIAAAGIGAGVGSGLRRVAIAVMAVRDWRPRQQMLAVLVSVALVGASAFGVSRAPEILMYGPWSGVVRAKTPSGAHEVTFRYWSRAFQAYRQALVVLPREYIASSGMDFPVLYLLHGSPGSYRDWAREGAGDIVAAATAAKRAPPLVIVYPDGVGSHGGAEDHWADNYLPGDRMESDLLDDLIPAVEAQFRVVSARQYRAIAGLSSGGYGSANLALRHPAEFGLAMVLAGDLVPSPDAFGGDQAALIANNPLQLALAPKPADASAFFVGWGAADPYASDNQLLSQRFQARGYDVRTDVVSGTHSWDVWRQLLQSGLDQMGDRIASPKPH